MLAKPDPARSWAQVLGAALARKNRLHDWQMLALYWTMQVWTLALNLSNASSLLRHLLGGASIVETLTFVTFLIGSNALYLYVWLADPGYVRVSFDQELGRTPPPPKANPGTETAVLLKRASVGVQQVSINDDDEPSSSSAPDAHYCYLCDHTLPPRAHHCRQCDRCVAKFDHHCPFLNNCVGARTHSAFIAYCFCQSATMAYATISLLGLIGFFEDGADPYLNGLYALTATACAFLCATSAFLFVGHVVLAARNVTTWEYILAMRIRQQKWRGEPVRYAAPGNYNHGCIANLTEDCAPAPRPEYIVATRIVRHNASWDDGDDVDIDTFDAELDSIQPLTIATLSD